MAKKKTTKKEETKPIGIKAVPESDVKLFEKLKKDLSNSDKELTSSELFSLLLKLVSTGDNKAITDEITTLHDEIARIQKESDLKSLAITELENKLSSTPPPVDSLQPQYDEAINQIEIFSGQVQQLLTAIGCETYSEAIDKAIQLNKNIGNSLTLQPQIELLTSELAQKDNIINELTDEISTMKTELSDLKENHVTLGGKQFIADINEENHSIVAKYRNELYQKKIISGNQEQLPNEVMNWAIKKAMQVTFGKL